MEVEDKKRKLVQFLLNEGALVDPEFLTKLNSLTDPNEISNLVNEKVAEVKGTKEKPKSNVPAKPGVKGPNPDREPSSVLNPTMVMVRP